MKTKRMAFNRKKWLAVMAFQLAVTSAVAMDFNLIGDTLIMSGPVLGDDVAHFKDQVATNRVKLVLLHNSPGGDLWNGQELARRIREAGLDTAVSGRCESACGLVFLGGVNRYYSDGSPLAKTMIGLHGAHNKDTKQAMPQLGARMAYLIREMTEKKFPDDLLDRTVYPKDPSDFTYVFHPARFKADGNLRGVMECNRQADTTFKCKMVEGLDAISVGATTSSEVLRLNEEVRTIVARP
ncbi:MAG: hypothetical protein ABI893_01035 [Polaromonas sp.]|uniref:hypothetical protein n=1 Tax=Polaromonas sp. TaxID=1869339 RepID=UPI003262FBFE